MAKVDITPPAANEAPPPRKTLPGGLPSLGDQVQVVVAPGMRLVNNETGGLFAADTPTPQTVTVTTIRRLQAGDLLLA